MFLRSQIAEARRKALAALARRDVLLPGDRPLITFSFDDKLATYDTNNFLIRFGDSASSNFNIQNLYILENSFTASSVAYLHQEFTGKGLRVRVNDSASYSFNITDAPESNYTSAS